MNTSIQFLDAVKAKHGGISDYALAKLLSVSQPTVSRYRSKKGTLDDLVCFRVAELLELEPAAVLAAVHAERAKTEKEKTAWKLIYERLGGVAASVALAVLLAPSPSASARVADDVKGNSVYYVKSRRRLNPNPFLQILQPFIRAL